MKYTDPNYYRYHADEPEQAATLERIHTYYEAKMREDCKQWRANLSAHQPFDRDLSHLTTPPEVDPANCKRCSLDHANPPDESFCFECGEPL